MRANPSVKERAPWPPRRSRAEERRLQCARMYNFEVVVPTRTGAGGVGMEQGPERDRDHRRLQPSLRNR
jgi:hypothetical protein